MQLNSVLVQKEYHAFPMEQTQVSLYFEDRNKGELALFFRKMHLGFFFDLIFFHKS